MTAKAQKSLIITKRETISLEFKGIFCFQSGSDYFSSILQIFDVPGSVSLSQGNQPQYFIKYT